MLTSKEQLRAQLRAAERELLEQGIEALTVAGGIRQLVEAARKPFAHAALGVANEIAAFPPGVPLDRDLLVTALRDAARRELSE